MVQSSTGTSGAIDSEAFGFGEGDLPECGVSLAAAGRMKAGRDDANRAAFFAARGIDYGAVVSCTQVHSRLVHVADDPAFFRGYPEGDGIITRNRALVPCVTVADCMPIFLVDPVSGCFGVLHSGWKGTGILAAAVKLAESTWGAKPSDFRVLLGPHIRDCCYSVDGERASYFEREFSPSCVRLDPARQAAGDQWPWRLSLAEANRRLALKLGIPDMHIHDLGRCTACDARYGSNRREGPESFTHMAAFIRWPKQ